MPFVYILESETARRFYIGCAEDPLIRLKEHQRGQTVATRGHRLRRGSVSSPEGTSAGADGINSWSRTLDAELSSGT
jgi:hypothetical protein